MRKETVVLAAILTMLGTNTNAARKTTARAGTKVVVGGRATTNVNVSGTTTSISATIADTTAGKTAYTQIAPITDKQAERECTNLVVQALKKQCKGANKCKNATETYASLSFKDENLDSSTDISIPSDYRETYCANFLETAVNKLWNSYDSVANLNEENCNVALARSLAAEACYRDLLADKNNDTMFKNNRDTSKCNASSIVDMYKELTGLSEEESPDATALTKLQKDDISDVFTAVGKLSWKTSILTNIGRLGDLNFSGNTDEYPRELVQLVNSLKSQGNVMCGPERYTELYDTNFALSQTSSSIEKAVQEKGILKGAFDWTLDQASVIMGEDRVDAVKDRGMIPNKTEAEKAEKAKEKKDKADEKKLKKCMDECGKKHSSASTEYNYCIEKCKENNPVPNPDIPPSEE